MTYICSQLTLPILDGIGRGHFQGVVFCYVYLIICILYYGINILTCNSSVMAYKKTQPLYLRQKHNKSPWDDSNYGPLPTARQLLQAKGRPPQGKTTIGHKSK